MLPADAGKAAAAPASSRSRWPLAAGAAALLALCIFGMLAWGSGYLLPRNYTFHHIAPPAGGGVELYALAVKPEHIELRAADRPLRDYRVYGLNGGFFYQSSVLSIAVNNDMPVKGRAGEYGSGWFNAKYPRGTLVWDEAAGRFSVQVVSAADELEVTDRGRYFAQGGVSMNLGDEAGWEAAMLREHLPYPNERRLRSGLVYDDTGLLWLVATGDRCTAAEFRAAVAAGIAPGTAKEGVFLDGDGSAQLKAAEHSLYGDSRDLQQIIVIR
ncbi:hypothetical protein V3851_06895 [Paenibacillus sp. M1]|uniref:Phosphodiester glycosidase domain-containing protein n=1 Tax=Paenibacillus haidiansis TaxID=1574488 RepID=A0ABU7VP71_9BACL